MGKGEGEGEGEEIKTRDEPKVEIQERGEIFFFYRPKVNQEEAHSVDDVQKMYIVLRPESGERKEEEKQSSLSGKEGAFRKSETGEEAQQESPAHDEQKKEGGKGSEKVDIEKQPLMRFIVMGRKSLPDPSKRTRPYWGFVEIVTTKPEDIKKSLSEDQYETATRGTRVKPAARPLAEGVYRILRHYHTSKGKEKGMHTHLVYKLELPSPEGKHEPQDSLNVEPESSFIIQIKNPEQAAPPNAGLQGKRRASFPARLQGQIGSRHFVAADPPDFLNYEGCEFILISASDDIDVELGLDVKTEDMTDENYKSCSDLVNMFGEISSIKPLIAGTWA